MARVTIDTRIEDLNAIFAMVPGFERERITQQFLSNSNGLRSDVKLVTASGKPMHVPVQVRDTDPRSRAHFKMEPFYISPSPQGRRMTRKLALLLMEQYGEWGKYRGVHRASGMRPGDIHNMNEDMLNRYLVRNPNFKKELAAITDDYLIHVPDTDELDDIENLVAGMEARQTPDI